MAETPVGAGRPGTPLLVPTVRGWVAGGLTVVLAALGWRLGVEEFVLLACGTGAVAGSCALVLWGRVRTPRPTAELSTSRGPREVPVGGEGSVELRVAAPRRGRTRPLWLEDPRGGWIRLPPRTPLLGSRSPVPPPIRRAPAAAWRPVASRMWTRWRPPARLLAVHPLLPGQRFTVATPVPTRSRGVYTLSAPALWEQDPFRLFASLHAKGSATTVAVCPVPAEVSVELPVLPTSQNASAVSVEIRAGAHEEQRAVLSLEGEHMALRPYVAGDRLHRLHWPALARNGELLIRDTEGVRSGAGKVVVLLDVRRTVHDRYSLDRAVELAAGVAVFAFERDLAVAIVTTAGDALTVEPGHDATRDMLRWLAGVGPGPAGVSTSTPGNASGISHSRRVATPRVVVTSPRGAQNLPAEMRGLLVTR